MEIASLNYMAELMEDPIFFHQYPTTTTTIHDNFDIQAQNDSYFNYETKPNRFSLQTSPVSSPPSSTPQLISFQKSSSFEEEEDDEEKVVSNYDNRKNFRNKIQAKEHVLAERKRREKLTQSFIALSAIVPGLKKMDKASVLGDAITYMKQLQERVQTLEKDQAVMKESGSSILVKKSILFNDDDENSSSRGGGGNCNSKSLPEMEVKVWCKDVLIKIQCDKHCGRVATVLGELEKHNLTVQSSNFLPFGNNIVDVTIVAQMNKENCVTAKDLLGSLRQALIL